MLRVTASMCLILFVFCELGFAAKQMEQDELATRNLILEAFSTDNKYRREEKLEKVIETHPEEYHALIALGGLTLEKGIKSLPQARDFFLRAALAQPGRPEAYLCLAQAAYMVGDMPNATSYMMQALQGAAGRKSYEAICLEGQQFLDSCNYSAAVITFAEAGLSTYSPYFADRFLLKKLYQACTLSLPADFRSADLANYCYWVPYVWMKILIARYPGGSKTTDRSIMQEFLKQQSELINMLCSENPRASARMAQTLINNYFYYTILGVLRREVGDMSVEEISKERFKLSDQFYNFGMCQGETFRSLDQNVDLFDVFIEASVPDPKRRKELLKRLREAIDTGLKQVENISDPKERGRELFRWLRQNVLVKYDAVNGIPAEGVIDEKKFLCLTGAIVYTLAGREAGLDTRGVLVPGHAFSVLYTKTGKVNVETTSPLEWKKGEQPTGFDMAQEQLTVRGTDARGNPYIRGEVTPLELVAAQFSNVAYNRIADLTLNKYGTAFKDILRKDYSMSDREVEDIERKIRLAESHIGDRYILDLAKQNPAYFDELVEAVYSALDDWSRARSFNPFDRDLLRNLEWAANSVTNLALENPRSAMKKRKEEQEKKELAKLKKGLKEEINETKKDEKDKKAPAADTKTKDSKAPASGKTDTAASTTTAASAQASAGPQADVKQETAPGVEEEPSDSREDVQKWAREKKVWMNGLKRLEQLVKHHPCSSKIQRTLVTFSKALLEQLDLAKEINSGRADDQRLLYDDLVSEVERVRSENSMAFSSNFDIDGYVVSKLALLKK